MEEEYSKYLIYKLFSDFEYNYEYGIKTYDEFIAGYDNNTCSKGEEKDE